MTMTIFSTLNDCYTESFKTLLSRWSMQSETDMADASKCNTEVSSKQGAIPKRRHRDVNYTEKFKKLLFRWSTQSETDVAGVGACNTDVPIKQGAKPLGNHKDETEIVKENPALHIKKYSTGMEENGIEEKKAEESSKQNRQTKDRSQIHATCQVEGKNIDESAAVQSLSDSKNESPLDLEFNITSAKRKCILLELEVPTKVLEDKQLFRVALRALIVKIARAGKVDFNKESTIILHLTFNDDLTEADQQSPNADWLRDKYVRLVNENVTLKAENGHLLKEIYAQRETISNLKMEVNTYQKELFQMSGKYFS
ncbi:Hypothetical predicted protein [Mytilus galloprovincialis]|uniref:Uncharacterized protein n=1 Tax=Mytilus galloprovincialis TaxID=29158 RepID=A0A8B6GMX4_MYTGA|nr:Hypothetical predicted protein [Mytilus galloprovincialis]